MTDKEFQSKINKAVKLATDHRALLNDLEEEYERRFGHDSSRDDWWIDGVHHGHGSSDLKKIIEKANEINL